MKHIKLFENFDSIDAKTKARIAEIEAEIEKLEVIDDEHKKNFVWDFKKSHEENSKLLSTPEGKKIRNLDRELRMIMPYELSPISDFGDVMTLKEFIGNVKGGGFIDYDGFGRYVKDDKESNIEIYPSDVKNNSVRKDFDKIIWFNR